MTYGQRSASVCRGFGGPTPPSSRAGIDGACSPRAGRVTDTRAYGDAFCAQLASQTSAARGNVNICPHRSSAKSRVDAAWHAPRLRRTAERCIATSMAAEACGRRLELVKELVRHGAGGCDASEFRARAAALGLDSDRQTSEVGFSSTRRSTTYDRSQTARCVRDRFESNRYRTVRFTNGARRVPHQRCSPAIPPRRELELATLAEGISISTAR